MESRSREVLSVSINILFLFFLKQKNVYLDKGKQGSGFILSAEAGIYPGPKQHSSATCRSKNFFINCLKPISRASQLL
jgi:hypothetical protein